MRKDFTIADLRRTFIRVQFEDGHFDSVSLYDATDRQFSNWARGRIYFEGNDTDWSLDERADLCDFIEREQGELVKVKEEMMPELEALLHEPS